MRIGRGPTPMLYYAAATLGVDGGVMVTGSHNPPDHNGFKFVFQGKSFYGAAIQKLGETAGRLGSSERRARTGRRARDPRRLRRAAGARLSRRPAADRRLGSRKRRDRRRRSAAHRASARQARPAERDDRRHLSGPSSGSDDPGESGSTARGGGARALRSRHCLRRRRRPHRRRRLARPDPVGRSADGGAGARCAEPASGRTDPCRCKGEPGAVRRDRAPGRTPGHGGHRAFADQGKARRDGCAARRRNERPHLLCGRLLRVRRRGLCRRAAARHPVEHPAQSCRDARPAAFGRQHAGTALSVLGDPQIRSRARGPRTLAQGGRRDDRHRRRARAHCRRLVAIARLQHPGGPRRPRRIRDRRGPRPPQTGTRRRLAASGRCRRQRGVHTCRML